MKRLLSILVIATMAMLTASAQKVAYQVKYSYEYDMQTYDYISPLDYAEGTIVVDGERTVDIDGQRLDIASKDADTATDQLVSRQFTARSTDGREYVVCINTQLTFPDELKYQVVVFDTSNPYRWKYYITDQGKQIK